MPLYILPKKAISDGCSVLVLYVDGIGYLQVGRGKEHCTDTKYCVTMCAYASDVQICARLTAYCTCAPFTYLVCMLWCEVRTCVVHIVCILCAHIVSSAYCVHIGCILCARVCAYCAQCIWAAASLSDWRPSDTT